MCVSVCLLVSLFRQTCAIILSSNLSGSDRPTPYFIVSLVPEYILKLKKKKKKHIRTSIALLAKQDHWDISLWSNWKGLPGCELSTVIPMQLFWSSSKNSQHINVMIFFFLLKDYMDSYALVAVSILNHKPIFFFLWKVWNCHERNLQQILERGIPTCVMFFPVEPKRCECCGQLCTYN